MERFDKIIALLMAIANFAKDIHYNVSGSAAYAKHLFADLLQDNIYDFIDEIKENIFLSAGRIPLGSAKYLEMTTPLIPEIAMDDRESFERMRDLIEKANKALTDIKDVPSRGAGSLLDSISEHLDKCLGLLFLQLRKTSVTEEFEKEENEGQAERPVDRKEAKRANIDMKKVADTIEDYEAQNLLVAEENTLDKLSKRLGV